MTFSEKKFQKSSRTINNARKFEDSSRTGLLKTTRDFKKSEKNPESGRFLYDHIVR